MTYLSGLLCGGIFNLKAAYQLQSYMQKILKICIHPLKRYRMHAVDSAKGPFGTA